MADLIAYTDLQTYLNVTFTAGEITTANNACAAASDAIRTAMDRTFEIQGAAANRYFTYTPPANSQNWASWYYYPWPAVFPFSAMNLTLPVPVLAVDDFFLVNQTISSITVTDATSAATYTPTNTYPLNANAKGYPSTGLVFASGVYLPTGEGGLIVNAKWGWPTMPLTITNAALLQASRYFKRKDALFGIAGTDAMGNAMRLQARLDPDVELMVTSGRRWVASV